MAKIAFCTHYNPAPSHPGDYTDIKSQATPDSAYTLRDLITQFATGVREFEEIVGNYDEHPDFDTVSPLNNPKFDLADFSVEQFQIAEQHLAYERDKKEKQQHLKLLQEQEAARKEAIEKAKSKEDKYEE